MNLAAAFEAAPQPINTFEHFTIKASEAKTGDTWNQLVVSRAASKVGPKWTELRTEDGTLIKRVESDSELRVGRWIETEESKAARNAFVTNTMIETAARNWAPTLPTAIAKLEANSSHFEVHNMLGAKAHDNIIGGYVAMALRMAESGEHTWAEINAEVKVMATKRLIDKARYCANRSTSQISNIMDDMELEELAKVADGGLTGRGW